MQQLEHHNEYIVTFEGTTPDQAGSRYFIAHDYATAQTVGTQLAYQYGFAASWVLFRFLYGGQLS